MKAVQYFSKEYLEQCKLFSPLQIVEFLDGFRRLREPSRSRLISLKVPESLLQTFRGRCRVEGVRYQTRIKQLMEEWLTGQGVSGLDSCPTSVYKRPSREYHTKR